MAITFPRGFPVLPRLFAECNFDLSHYQGINQLVNGITQVVDVADARWVGEWTTIPVTRDDAQIWKAWRDSLQGGMKFFRGYDAEQSYPQNYKTGFSGLVQAGTSTPFTGTAIDVTALTTTTISLAQLPAAFTLKTGDYIELDQGIYVGLHRILEDVTSTGGGTTTVTVEPFVLTNIFTASATGNIVKASAVFVLDSESWSASRNVEAAPITFKGIQKPV